MLSVMPDASSPRPTALVTGPTSGIGRAFAHALAARGHDLVLVARDRRRLDEVAAEIRGRHSVEVEVLTADLCVRAELGAVERRVADETRPIAVLVNNAGFGLRRGFSDNAVDDEQGMLDVLVVAVLRLSHAALGPMLGRGAGAVVNVSSVAGFLPNGTYSASKAWVTSFTEWLDLAYRRRGVRAMAVCPGYVRTELHARMGVGTGSIPRLLWLDADGVAREALLDLERGRRISIPSKRYKTLVTAARVTPRPLLAAMVGPGRGRRRLRPDR
jgi:short-subunit dehydrogenase